MMVDVNHPSTTLFTPWLTRVLRLSFPMSVLILGQQWFTAISSTSSTSRMSIGEVMEYCYGTSR